MDNTEFFPLTEERCYHLHFYKELMSPEERRDRYTSLRLSGATPSQARSWRDWSPNHYQMMVDYLCNPVPLAERLENNRLGLSEAGSKSTALATG